MNKPRKTAFIWLEKKLTEKLLISTQKKKSLITRIQKNKQKCSNIRIKVKCLG